MKKSVTRLYVFITTAVFVTGLTHSETPAPESLPERPHKYSISDVVLGMTVDEVHSNLRTHQDLIWKDNKLQLQFQSDRGMQSVPGGEYVAFADAANFEVNRPVVPGVDVYRAQFTPPYGGNGHLWWFSHAYFFERGKEIHVSTMIESLKKKYGEPGLAPSGANGGNYYLIWTSTPAKLVEGSSTNPRGQCYVTLEDGQDGFQSQQRMGGMGSSLFAFRTTAQSLAACGDVVLTLLYTTPGASPSPDTQLVQGYAIVMISPDVAVKGMAAAGRLTEAAAAASSKDSANRAKEETGPKL